VTSGRAPSAGASIPPRFGGREALLGDKYYPALPLYVLGRACSPAMLRVFIQGQELCWAKGHYLGDVYNVTSPTPGRIRSLISRLKGSADECAGGVHTVASQCYRVRVTELIEGLLVAFHSSCLLRY